MLKNAGCYFAFLWILLCCMLFSNFAAVLSQRLVESSVLNSFGSTDRFY